MPDDEVMRFTLVYSVGAQPPQPEEKAGLGLLLLALALAYAASKRGR